jgi:hypothetical protein
MSRVRHRQLSRLEKLAAPAIDSVRRKDDALKQWVKHCASLHAISLGALILYGNPNVDEPLGDAWQRCSSRFPILQRVYQFRSLNLSDQSFAEEIAQIVRKDVMSDLPGTTEAEKFQNMFFSAPPWLIWFTFATVTAKFLGFALPDLSSVTSFSRSKAVFDIWPALPDGKFELRPRYDNIDDGISALDAVFFAKMIKIPVERMTRLERKRFKTIFEKLPPPNRTA